MNKLQKIKINKLINLPLYSSAGYGAVENQTGILLKSFGCGHLSVAKVKIKDRIIYIPMDLVNIRSK